MTLTMARISRGGGFLGVLAFDDRMSGDPCEAAHTPGGMKRCVLQ